MASHFERTVIAIDESFAGRRGLGILQVNLGNICNQRCSHCHINASPKGDKIMPREIIDDVAAFLSRAGGLTLDITGGCPELNPHFTYCIEKAKPHAKTIMVRSNLTVILEKKMGYLPEFYKKNGIKLVCSLPCYTKENVDRQRGEGVFTRSIEALKKLNAVGYARLPGLDLDLVYNPGGAFLPGDQKALEADYKRVLGKEYGIAFNRLITITNAPINRFREYLKARGDLDTYMNVLINNFNPDVAGAIMCRNLLSVGWDGTVYDCDFNQALGLALRGADGRPVRIKDLDPDDLTGRRILFEDHCFCCTAGAGSSCSGALT